MSKKQQVDNKVIAEEVKNLIEHIQEMEKELISALPSFRQAYEGCQGIREWQGQGLSNPQFLQLFCEKGSSYLTNSVIKPLLIRLLDYRDLLLGTKAYTTKGYATLMKGLVSTIHRYTVISSYFARFPFHLVPGSDPKAKEFRDQFKKTIIQHNRRLMGCDDGGDFPIQDIAKKVGMTGDHNKIMDYLTTECLSLRSELLKVPGS